MTIRDEQQLVIPQRRRGNVWLAVLAVIGVIAALVLLSRFGQPRLVRLISTLSDHAARRAAWILAGFYAAAILCGIAGTLARRGWLRWTLRAVAAVAALSFLLLLPGRIVGESANLSAVAAAGDTPAFAHVLTWMSLLAAFAALLMPALAKTVLAERRSWARWLVVAVVLAGYWVGGTALVVHLNAPGAEGATPRSFAEYAAAAKVGDTFRISGGTPVLAFTTVRHLGCDEASTRLISPGTALSGCRDAVELDGVGRASLHAHDTGGVSCVVLVPDLGHDTASWAPLLDNAHPTTPPAGSGTRHVVSYALTFRDGDMWLTCAENRGTLKATPGAGQAPLIRDVVDYLTAIDVGLL